MITKIDICKAASFSDNTISIDELKQFNYFFGANGTGKTTISKVIDEILLFPDCQIHWENGQELERRVYNRKFVENNFNSINPLKGVFTLGEQDAAIEARIEEIKKKIYEINTKLSNLNGTLNGVDQNKGKKTELHDLENKYEDRFFVQKQENDQYFAEAFEGFRGSKDKFKQKVLEESVSNNSIVYSREDLIYRASQLYSKNLSTEDPITEIQLANLNNLAKKPILIKKVIGKQDVDIAEMILKLGNNDWVQQGNEYYKKNENKCPFCQQMTTEGFAKSLNDYFDESYKRDCEEIDTLLSEYNTESQRVLSQLHRIKDENSQYLDMDAFVLGIQLLDSVIFKNLQLLETKIKEASQVCNLESIQEAGDLLNRLIREADIAINENNRLVSNIKNEKATLKGQIWRYIVKVLENDINEYKSQKEAIEKAIHGLEENIWKNEEAKKEATKELNQLEKQSTSIQPTLDGMNHILRTFGFHSFFLTRGDDDRTYRMIRENGVDAQSTLSEGERNFITFLYFYYLIAGSQSETGLSVDKVVVFDDPVSSLDSDVLFIVSSLIRNLIEDIRQKSATAKQVFVLTHNVYFFKELTYNSKRPKDGLLNEETFWLLRKGKSCSEIERQLSNPIKTSYELLWEEIRNGKYNNLTLQNTLRRILEAYFKMLGGIHLDQMYLKFDGEDRIRCKDLCSWVNDGSHSGGILSDEYYSPPDDSTVERYLDIFKQIFEKHEQLSHYNMMMGVEAGKE